MLAPAEGALILDLLNDLAPDTFDEGELGPWRFTELDRSGSTWTLTFEVGDGKPHRLPLTFDGPPMDGGFANGALLARLTEAVIAWQAQEEAAWRPSRRAR